MTHPTDLEQRIRALITELETWEPKRGVVVGRAETPEDRARDHWFNCGQDEAHDSIIERLYWVLGEDR